MTVAEQQTSPSRTADVIAWRREQLGRSGYGATEASLLADHVEVDLHEAMNLAGRGCPPELAVRILQ